jgi:hypothetical protein
MKELKKENNANKLRVQELEEENKELRLNGGTLKKAEVLKNGESKNGNPFEDTLNVRDDLTEANNFQRSIK